MTECLFADPAIRCQGIIPAPAGVRVFEGGGCSLCLVDTELGGTLLLCSERCEDARCDRPSAFQVTRSDGDTSYGINGGSDECCTDHLADAVLGMADGDDKVQIIVTIRWDRPDHKPEGN